MPQIPVPKGCRGDSRTPRQRELLRNCYFEDDGIGTINTRPVARSIKDGVGRCRGSGFFKDELYQVSNDKLIRITLIDANLPPTESNTQVDILGTIAGGQDCVLRSSFTQMVIVVVGGAGYVYDKSNGLRAITDPSYKPSVSVDFDSGNFVFVPFDGDPFFFCSDFNLNSNPASAQFEFADAEEFTDLNKCVITRKRQIYIGGARSFERLEYNAAFDTYQAVGGSTSNYGYVGGLTEYGDTFMFIGQGANGGFSFFIMNEVARPLPNKFVDEILASYDVNTLENVVGETFRWMNHDFAIFYLPDYTIVFNGDFVLWHSGTLGDGYGPWRVSFMQTAYGYIWTGDTTGATIGILTEDDKEYEEDIEFEMLTYIRAEPRVRRMVKRLQVDLNSGINGPDQKLGLSISGDGKIFGPMHYRSVGEPGDYKREVWWGPLMLLDNYMGVLLRGSGNMRLSIDALTYKI